MSLGEDDDDESSRDRGRRVERKREKEGRKKGEKQKRGTKGPSEREKAPQDLSVVRFAA